MLPSTLLFYTYFSFETLLDIWFYDEYLNQFGMEYFLHINRNLQPEHTLKIFAHLIIYFWLFQFL